MTITLVICSYRYGHLAAHAIESVLSQTRRPERIIFVDDGALDCDHLRVLYPQIRYVMRATNLGIVDNFQDMLNQVDTSHVMFLGADNWLRSDALELVSEPEADICTYDIIVTGEDKKEILFRHPKEIERFQGDYYWDRSSGHHGSMLYNVGLAKKVGGYKPSGGRRSEEDKVLFKAMMREKPFHIHIGEALLYYRRHKQNFYQ